jgi:hypothetical protein
MHPRLAVSAICSWSLGFDEDMALWADLGIDHVGLFLEKLENAGLDCQGFVLDDRTGWPERWVALNAAVDAAAAVDAHCFFVTAGTPGRLGFDDAVAALADALAPVHDHASDLGVPVAVEHTNPMRRDIGFIHSLRDMVEVARLLDVGVVVEITNCWS